MVPESTGMLANGLRLLALAAFLGFGAIETAHAESASSLDVVMPKWEPFVDLYGGYATTDGDDVEAEITNVPFFGFVTQESGTRQVSYDPSFVVGARLGAFYDFVGFALDTSYFRARDENVRNDVVTVSALLMFRLKLLASDNMPNGRFQPYAGIGPAAFLLFQDIDFRPDISEKIDVLSAGVGFDARAGLRWFFNANAGLFAEYRIARANFRHEDKSGFLSTTETKVTGSLTTQHILGGLTFTF
jgi:opacity protein-like surface antigen